MADARISSLRELVDARSGEIKTIVTRHHGRAVALFGSVARDEDHDGSDVDLLVEFEPGTRPFQLLLLGADLEDVLGVSVDVATVDSLRPELRDEVMAQAIPL